MSPIVEHPTCVELSFVSFRGLTLRGKAWGVDHERSHRLLALHGWLDNCATWDYFLPLLLKKNPEFYVVAIDFAGHGESDRRSNEADYLMHNYVEDAVAVIESLNWDSFSIIGHSMGGAVGLLLSAVLSRKVRSITVVDNFGPFTSDPVRSSKNSIAARSAKRKPNLTIFESAEHAVDVRMKTGLHFISEAPLRLLVERGLTEHESGTGYVWSTDPFVAKNSPFMYSEEDVLAFLAQVKSPVLAIFGNEGLFTGDHPSIDQRMKAVENLKFRTS
ncbi:hypothetical protein HDU83_006028 [Entophlyctis luteolus]|nr:hypothetical protein HDU82_002848 [Entophlyctis luteolus]KAJ3354012.1 hypothetical protein HDU83_006028 [Entophlyctis luteolus]